MKKPVLIAAFLLLAGCATPVDTQHVALMNGYAGKTERDLIYAWGVPDKTYETDSGTKILTYTRGRRDYLGGGFQTCTGSGTPGFGFTQCYGGMPAQTVTYYCDFSFNVQRGRVMGWFEHGNDCPRTK